MLGAWGRCEREGCVDVPDQREDKFTISSPFCFIPILSGLDGAHPHWEGPYALLSLCI